MASNRVSGVRVLIDRILEFIEQHSAGLCLGVEVSGSIVKVTADLSGGPVLAGVKPEQHQVRSGRAASPEAAPTDPSEYADKIKECLANGKPKTLKALAKRVAPGSPKAVLKGTLAALVNEGVLLRDIRGYRLAGAAVRKRGRPPLSRGLPARPEPTPPPPKPAKLPVPARKRPPVAKREVRSKSKKPITSPKSTPPAPTRKPVAKPVKLAPTKTKRDRKRPTQKASTPNPATSESPSADSAAPTAETPATALDVQEDAPIGG
ncbi:MAG: phaF [bacterium]|nr:MAG: phaF [bacterium]